MRPVVTQSVTSGNVIATARRDGIQTQQIYRWRERLEALSAPAASLAVGVASDSGPLCPAPLPAPVLDSARRGRDPASRLERSPRAGMVLSAGRRIIVEGVIRADAEVALARDLDGLR